MNSFDIVPLFSIPVATTTISGIDNTLKDYLYSLPFERVRNGCCSYSVAKKVLDDPHCQMLKEQIESALDDYIETVQGIDTQNFKFLIKTSWVLKLEPGDYADEHYHSKSIFSGVLYLDVPDDSSRINFHRPPSHIDPMTKWFEWNIKNWNIYNCERFFVQPKNNMLVFFPSYLGHSTEQNNSDTTRYCLAFDVFVKGSMQLGLPGEIIF
jgi:uncharacterized protein (TIGR02466 family)